MDSISSALGSIPTLVWGEHALANLGARNICQHYMLIVEDADFDDAVQKLRLAGFRDWAWSFGSLEPDFYKGALKQMMYHRIVHQFSNLDRNSACFLFPLEKQTTAKVALLPSSYTHIDVRSVPDDMVIRDGNMLYPNGPLLLRSFVQTLVREPVAGWWTSSLASWAITHAYGNLMLDDDVLDSCDDEEAKAWFNKEIRRYSGGMDRITCTKRLGKVVRDENLAKMRPAC